MNRKHPAPDDDITMSSTLPILEKQQAPPTLQPQTLPPLQQYHHQSQQLSGENISTARSDKTTMKPVRPGFGTNDPRHTYMESTAYPRGSANVFGSEYTTTSGRGTLKGSLDTEGDVMELIRNLKHDIESLKDCVGSKDSGQNTYASLDGDRTSDKKAQRSPLVRKLQDRGYPRLSYICDSHRNICTRFLWTFILLCCMAVLGYQLWDRFSLYVSSPTHTRVERLSVRDLPFPAVSICNLNSYRLTEVDRLGVYPLIHSAITNLRHDNKPRNLPQRTSVVNMPYFEFVKKVAHKKSDFIQRCYWNGVSCSHVNFTEFFDLDQGHCFTFTPHPHARDINRAGPASGLSLLLNVEQYEYVLGRVTSVGVKAVVHDRGTRPRLHTDGVNAAVGSYTSMAITKIKRREVGACSACGQTGTEPDEMAACIRENQYDLIRRRCGCEFSKAKHSFKKQCSVFDFFSCIINLREEVRDSKERRACTCHSACSRTEYDLGISEASMSVYAAESWMKSQHDVDVIEARFQKARDIYHKVDKVIFDHDNNTLNLVVQGLKNCSSNISMLSSNVSTYASEYESSRLKLISNIVTLNDSVNQHVDDFNRSDHVKPFVDLVKLARDKFSSIMDTKDSLLKFIERESFVTVNETLSRILRLIDYLVFPGNAMSNPRAFISEIAKEVKRFQEDILMGYGQFYREFKIKEHKNALQYEVGEILTLTDDITLELREEYSRIKMTTGSIRKKLSKVQTEKLTDTMQTFYNSIEGLSLGRYMQLNTHIQELSSLYQKHKKGVLNLAINLINIGKKLNSGSTATGDVSDNIRDSVKILKSNITTLQTTISNAAHAYLNGTGTKSAMAKAMEEGDLSSVMSLARNILDNLKDTLKINHRDGDELVALILPIEDRLVDFSLLEKKEVNDFVKKLKSPGIEKLAEGIVTMVEDQFSTISDYQGELNEYSRGTRINGKFYQNNFLQIELYFPEMVETTMYQEESYGIFALASDIGASLSLYLGASILTLFGLFDLLIRSRHNT